MDKILSELSSSLKQILKVRIPTHEATENEDWFCGKDVCEILGYEDINDTLLKGVKQSHKTDLKSLVELTCVNQVNSTSYHEGKTVYKSSLSEICDQHVASNPNNEQ